MYCFSTVEQFSKLRESVRQELKQLLDVEAEPMFVAVNEAVNNAIFHGNGSDSSKKVYLEITRLPGKIKVTIRDDGEGFKLVSQSNTADTLKENGRGLDIIGFCVDDYYYNEQPSEIVLIKTIAALPEKVEKK